MLASSPARGEVNSAQPGEHDILLGRNSRIFNNPGNVRYRYLVKENCEKYLACKTRLDRMILAREVTRDILDGGRVKFWKPNKPGGKWNEVNFQGCQDKVSHALCDTKGFNNNTAGKKVQKHGNASDLAQKYIDTSDSIQPSSVFMDPALLHALCDTKGLNNTGGNQVQNHGNASDLAQKYINTSDSIQPSSVFMDPALLHALCDAKGFNDTGGNQVQKYDNASDLAQKYINTSNSIQTSPFFMDPALLHTNVNAHPLGRPKQKVADDLSARVKTSSLLNPSPLVHTGLSLEQIACARFTQLEGIQQHLVSEQARIDLVRKSLQQRERSLQLDLELTLSGNQYLHPLLIRDLPPKGLLDG